MIELVTLLFFKKYECKISSFTFSIIKVVHIIMQKTYSYEFKLSVINFYYSKFWKISHCQFVVLKYGLLMKNKVISIIVHLNLRPAVNP